MAFCDTDKSFGTQLGRCPVPSRADVAGGTKGAIALSDKWVVRPRIAAARSKVANSWTVFSDRTDNRSSLVWAVVPSRTRPAALFCDRARGAATRSTVVDGKEIIEKIRLNTG